MKPTTQTLLVVNLMAVACAGTALGATGEGRYHSIALRNPFSLREPAPPSPITPLVKTTPPPKVVVTGLTDLGGIRKALLEITDPGQPVTRVILAEGAALESICVLRIDLPANRVKVRIHDTESFLNLEAEKPTTPPVPATPAKPLAPRPPAIRG